HQTKLSTITKQRRECTMELKGSKTEKNLMEAVAGESQARNKYTYFASQAKKEGYVQMAKIFEETAANEKEHAKIWFKLLNGGEIPDTATCLKMAAGGEHEEWTDRKSTRLNSSHVSISYAVFCLKKKKTKKTHRTHHSHT